MDYLDLIGVKPGGDLKWNDRLTYDGCWENNLYNFVTIVMRKLLFTLPSEGRIVGEAPRDGGPLYDGIREAIINSVTYSDFQTEGVFNNQCGKPIQIEGSREAVEKFKAVTAPFMLRRLKSDKTIISDLPDKIERDEFAALTKEQSALYQQTLNEAMREIEGIEETGHVSLFKRERLVLQMIMALFEEKINAMIQDKKQFADLTVGTGEKWLASMSDAELRSIFTLED